MRFESDVISDGTQTERAPPMIDATFEGDVISDGTQTTASESCKIAWFESDVISDGAQTQIYSAKRPLFRH